MDAAASSEGGDVLDARAGEESSTWQAADFVTHFTLPRVSAEKKGGIIPVIDIERLGVAI